MNEYPHALRDLISARPRQPLGPGRPVLEKRAALQALKAADLLAPQPVKDRDMARACLAGLWLAYNFHDESHGISQDLDTFEGSYWHAILHRREPDYWNSKYWFRRVGQHPIFEPLAKEAARLATEVQGKQAEMLGRGDGWDPFAFVDLCEKAATGSRELTELCERIQDAEWRLLLEYCVQNAVT